MKLHAYLLSLLLLIGFASCSDTGGIKPTATGAAFEVLVVMDNYLLKTAVGDSLIGLLNTDMACMPQSEPLFSISRTSHAGFSNLLKPARNIIIVNIDSIHSRANMKHFNDYWSRPQSMVKISGPSPESVAQLIGKYKYDLVDFFVEAERERAIAYQKRYSNKEATKRVKQQFGFEMAIPKGMNRFKEEANFLWIANASQQVRKNIIVYTTPYKKTSDFSADNILMRRDSILLAHIPGANEGSYMGTEYRYEPPMAKATQLNGSYAVEVRGLWKVHGDMMGGPFVSLSTLDPTHTKIITIETFLYAPNKYKRNILRQFEALLYSMKFPEPVQETTAKEE